jgi:hypothetical protein
MPSTLSSFLLTGSALLYTHQPPMSAYGFTVPTLLCFRMLLQANGMLLLRTQSFSFTAKAKQLTKHLTSMLLLG